MKLLGKINYLLAFWVVSLTFFSLEAKGAVTEQVTEQDSTAAKFDNVHISLLTCGGYDEVWALYGHAAMRVEMPDTGEDVVANWGLFDFHQPNFIGRFVFGKCDYLMGIVPFKLFMEEFSSKGASVFQQKINLTPEEKIAVVRALYENSMPENCMYRYNFLYDNCATRPRDIIFNNVPERVIYNNVIDSTVTFRNIIHDNNEQKPWCRLGNDLLMGVNADNPTSREDQQFLPAFLERDFANAMFVDSAGHKRAVVLKSEWILKDNTTYEKEFPLSPAACGFILMIVIAAVTVFERIRKKNFWILDTVLMSVCGILGLILFLMVFSEHPTVSFNLLILTFNPLLLVCMWRIVKELRGKKKPVVCRVYFCLVLLAVLLTNKDVIPFALQNAPEGFFEVSIALLMRMVRMLKK